MSRIFITFIFIILANLTFGQTAYSADTLMKQRNVKIKTQYKCDIQGSKRKILYQHHFDSNGRLTKDIEFSAGKPFLTAYYHYNQFGKADTIYRQFTGQDKYLSQVYIFDKKGNIIEYQSCFEKSGCSASEKYHYDNNDKLITKIEFRNGKADTEHQYIYDEQGNNVKTITKYVSYDNERTERNYFDSNNRKIRSISYDNDNNVIDSTEYSYDKKGNLLSLNWLGGLGTSSVYTYDTDGNEIEYRSTAFGNQINDLRKMTYKEKLVQTRVHYEGKSVKYFFKFDYEFH